MFSERHETGYQNTSANCREISAAGVSEIIMNTLIICNGRMKKHNKMYKLLKGYKRIIAVDGGVRHARKMGLKPDIVIGDFDSISEKDRNYVKKEKISLIKFPSIKDKTDSELALDYCIANGIKEITIVAYSGNRLDHTLANITMFSTKSDKLNIRLVDLYNDSYIVNGDFTYESEDLTADHFVSIIPMSADISIENSRGLHYPVNGKKVEFGSTLCVSNYTSDRCFSLTVSAGNALIVIAKEKKNDQ